MPLINSNREEVMLEKEPPALPLSQDRLHILRRVVDTITPMPFQTWNFGDSVGFEAMVVAGRVLNDRHMIQYAHGWMRGWASRSVPFRRMDCTAPGLAMVEVAVETNDGILIEALVHLARYLMSRPMDRGIYDTWEHMCLVPPFSGETLSAQESAWLAEPPSGTCVDCLHFDPPFFTSLGIAINSPEFVQVGVDQALAYIDAFQQPNGLFDHFFMRDIPGTFGPAWGRGQGWSMLGLLDVHKYLPHDHAAKSVIASSLRHQIIAMQRLQRPDGRWWCVVDEPESGEEGSTAPFMATGFLRAIAQGIFTRDEIEQSARLAVAATIGDLDSNAHLTNVTAAVAASTVKSHYVHTPRGFLVPWGQGPVAMALCEADRLSDELHHDSSEANRE